ncbi:MAG: alpha/beta hydrolase [Thermoplasmata archaeon]
MVLPTGAVRAGLVALNPAGDQSKDQILMRHLSQTLPPLGIAILRFDRHPKLYGWSVSLADQADDALAAIKELTARIGDPTLPVGIWGWDEGASAATVAAARSALVRFLILIGCSGVSPAEQMRYGTAEHLRRAGFGADAQAELLELRLAFEGTVRGTISRSATQKLVARYVSRRWFPLAWVPRRIQPRLVWPDMDFVPRKIFGQIGVPTLLFYGETDEWNPINPSIESWRVAQEESQNRDITIVRPRGTAHVPTIGSGMNARAISPDYTHAMIDWLTTRIARLSPPPRLSSEAPESELVEGATVERRFQNLARRTVSPTV